MKVKLYDVCDCASSSLKQSDIIGKEGEYPVFGAAGGIGKVGFYHQEKPYIAVVKDGAGIGRTMILPAKSSIIGTMQYLLPKDNILPEYLYYVVKYMHLEKYFSGATIPHIYFRDYKHEEFNLENIERQAEIVHTLQTANRILSARRRQLALLDEMVKARFVEMFGTLDMPSQRFRRDILGNLCTKITDGKHGGCTQEKGTNRFFIGAREIYDDTIHYDTAIEISVSEFEKDYKRCNVEKGDLLIVNTGATIGKSALATDERTEHTLLQKSVALIKVNPLFLHSVFLKYCYYINEKMYKVESASAQPNLLLSKIKSTEIHVPSIELQQQFADFVAQVNKTKAAVQRSLNEAKVLFDSLMQRYFG